jgi:hypothetical protein
MRGDMYQHGSINEPADQYQEADNVYPERHKALPAPTRISPAPATEQKQHQKNNQQGRHFTPLFSPVQCSLGAKAECMRKLGGNPRLPQVVWCRFCRPSGKKC